MTEPLPLTATLLDAAGAIRSGQVTPTQLAQHALAQIEQARDLNTIAYLDAGRALAEAAVLDHEARAGKLRGPLHGVPVTVKDLFNVRGMPTKGGTRATLPPIEPDEAAAVNKLRAAGALILAKTNMVELALGLSGENPWTGDVKNPHDPARQTGGSSSGSAAALAAGIGYASLGSDTAGSVRVPAAFCGVVGFKPSFGAVSLAGALPLCPSCDHAGPLARSVADAAAVFAVLRANLAPLPLGERLGEGGITIPPTLGIPRAYLEGAMTREMRMAFDELIVRLRARGATIKDVALALEDFAPAFAPMRAESLHIHRRALEAAPESFSPAVREALMQGYMFTALEYLDARHKQSVMRDAVHTALRGVDALLLPAVPGVAPVRGTTEIELESGARNTRLAILRFSGPFAFAGVPALSLPFAHTVDGLPLGAQIVTPFGTDDATLAMGAWVERALTD